MIVDLAKLNEAKWAACNMRYSKGGVPTMEHASEAAVRAVAAYIGVTEPDDLEKLLTTRRHTGHMVVT